MMQTRLKKLLKQREATSNYRAIVPRNSPPSIHVLYGDKPCLSFCSNDYLGLANHPKVVKAFKEAVDLYGVGSGGSFLVSGTCKAHTVLQEALADFMHYPRALLFSNGYMANLGIITTLAKRIDTIAYDRYCHASLLDGVQLSRAKSIRYRHQDIHSLDQSLSQSTPSLSHSLIITNGIFSTTGSPAPLTKLIEVAQKHQAWVMVDDTHGIGYLGAKGRGLIEETGHLPNPGSDLLDVPIVMSSFGKAFGTYGAFVAGSETVIEALTQAAYTRIFTTALPPAIAAATYESLRLIQNEPERRERLHARIRYFREQADHLDLPFLPSTTAIQSLLIGSSNQAKQLSEQLIAQGLLVKSLRPPAVPQDQALLRLSLSADHSEADIRQVLNAIRGLYHEES